MKEEYYINISNRVRIQTAQSLLRDVLIMEDENIIDEGKLKKIQYQLSEWTDKLFNKYKIDE